ncbi:MAG: ATP-dependent metallopeptidase FtsH/Yme1/Tma family protein [Alphaproteobacteria bacterium]|nr:ATP-dependent metallopeptidase FtsH/Yme1/Tma family protein [Alphaproteobacteria bacterium]
MNRSSIFLFVVVLGMLALFFNLPLPGADQEALAFPEFMQKVDEGVIKEVTIKGQQITGKLADDRPFHTTGPEFLQPVYNKLVEEGVTPSFEEAEDSGVWLSALIAAGTVAIVVLALFWFMRSIQGSNGRAMNFGKSRARLQSESAKLVTFDDVAGIEESKDELAEVVEFLRDPRRFTRLGGRIPKGVLLMGPPGTGKTLLARAVAGEAGVPFFSISGSDFVEMFVGVGASRVRDLFEQGKKHAPCIIFIDEIDAVGRHRGAGLGGGHDEREQTLNALLVEMDGFEGTEGVILVAATNRPDVLDPALLRPGRFDRRVVVPAPDVRGRKRILEIHTRKLPLGTDVDLDVVAKGTPRFSGADLENLCNEAALLAAREDKRQVDMADFLSAREKILMGPERRSMVMPEWERKNTAYHEAGHAIIAHLLPQHDPVHKVTIVPRGRALGVTMILPEEEQLSMTRTEMLQQITMMMGGRAAEEIAMNSVTGGAAMDLRQATKLARHMICDLGMSDELGPVSWNEGDGEVFLGRQMSQVKSYSEQTARRIDSEVRDMLARGYQAAKNILQENVHVLHTVAQRLMEIETLDAEEFEQLVEEAGPVRPANLAWMGV